MNRNLLFCLLIFPWTWASGQNNVITIQPEAFSQTFMVDLSEDILLQDIFVDVINNTDSTIQLGWKRYELDKPNIWETQVCDINECYFPIVSSNIDTVLGLNAPVNIAAGDTSKVALYITPYETSGTGMFALDFFLAEQPDSIIGSATFDVQISSLVVNTKEVIQNQDIRLYPNPSSDYFQLSASAGVDRMVLMNLLGRQVRTYRAFPGSRYDLNQVPDGIYLLSLVNDDYGIIKTLRLSKRGLRP